MIFNNLLLAMLFGFSLYIADQDMRTKRISNRVIARALLAGVLVYGAGLIAGAMSVTYVLQAGLNTLTAFAAGFLIWKLNLWPAGDAKFFMACSFLIPLQYYSKQFFYFPAFSFLMNMFLIYLVFMGYKFAIWAGQNIVAFFKSRVFLRKGFLRFLKMRCKRSLAVLGTAGFWKKLAYRVMFKAVFQVSLIAVAFVFFTKRSFQFQAFSVFFLFFLGVRMVFSAFVKTSGRRMIKAETLQPGMNLSIDTIKRVKCDREFFKGIGALRADGLTVQQAEALKEYLLRKNFLDIYIYDTIAFSPFIALGAAATVLANGSVLDLGPQIMM
ncbi:MAG TPA: prepilin peptidase [Candidatus Omnitrophota bacterium]|nr:prepilin peptidase [Candidatus Omnitrophota bacterium]